MKTTLYKLLFALLLVPGVVSANNGPIGKHTEQKTIKKEFRVGAQDLLSLDNSYGNIDLLTWDQNRVEIEVIIKTNGNDEEKVKQRLNEITVKFNQSAGELSAETIFKDEDKSWWSNLFGGFNNVNMEINYRVKAPFTNDLIISNDYGSINIDDTQGNVKLSCDYGRFLLGRLTGDKNYLNFDYTRNSSIEYVNNARIEADYSEFTIEEAGNIELSADYTDAHLIKVENIRFNNDYGSLKIDKLKNIKGQGDYLGVKLGLVYGSAELETDYGSLSIEKIMPSLKRVVIESDYTSIKIGYDVETAFSYEINTSYGGVEGLEGNGFTNNRRNQDGGDNYYSGHYRSENTGANIQIDSSYGSVNFNNRD